jgi:hypothetical protein
MLGSLHGEVRNCILQKQIALRKVLQVQSLSLPLRNPSSALYKISSISLRISTGTCILHKWDRAVSKEIKLQIQAEIRKKSFIITLTL